MYPLFFPFKNRSRHTRSKNDWEKSLWINIQLKCVHDIYIYIYDNLQVKCVSDVYER